MRETLGTGPRNSEERRARRLGQRRAARRRRLVALCVIGVTVLGVVAVALAGDDEPVRTSTSRNATPHAGVQREDQLGSGVAVTLAFGGDIHFESPIRERLATSPASILEPIAPVLRRADLAVVNLETAVTERGEAAAKAYTFRAPASAFAALVSGGVDVVNLANNHALDFGTTGLQDTLAAARRARLPVIGAGWTDRQAYAPYRVRINGQRIVVLGATQVLDNHLVSAWTAGSEQAGLASAKEVTRLVRAVRDARGTSDTLVVYLHWGLELAECPSSAQQSLAGELVAAGADVVVGSHAHVLGGAGKLGGALVAYGLGNLVFYAEKAITRRSGILEVTVTGRRIDGYRWVPAHISDGIPYPVTRDRATAIAQWHALRACTGLRP